MNFVCAAILMFVTDAASAFWLLCYVVEEVLVDHYVQSMIGHQVDTQVLPAVYILDVLFYSLCSILFFTF